MHKVLLHVSSYRHFKRGDIVIGNLPIAMVAALNKRGVRFFAICMHTSVDHRGVELNAKQMDAVGAKLIEYRVQKVKHRASESPFWKLSNATQGNNP